MFIWLEYIDPAAIERRDPDQGRRLPHPLAAAPMGKEQMEKFDLRTATKADCLAEAERLLNIAIRAEENGKGERMVDFGLRKACEIENAAFDGRS